MKVKQFRVKIGKLYIYEVSTSDDYVSANFINTISLRPYVSDYSFKINENEQEQIREILKNVFELENEFAEIQFEEVEEKENEKNWWKGNKKNRRAR